MAAYYKVDVSLNTNSVTVGSPSAQEVLVTLPLVGPQGATGATGASGASTWNEISGKPATFPPSAHEHQPDQVYADAAFVSQSGDSSLQIGIYLHNGTDNGRPVYESPTTGDYIWWDSNLDQWYLTSNTDVNLYYLDENADEFPWETDVVWNAIPPQTGNIEVDQAFLSDISDYGVASVIGLKTSKSGNASSTELVLGSDTRLTNSRTPSSTLAHASTHHTGGSDAVSPFSIGAESIFDASSNTLSGTPVTLTASRARVWTFPCFSATTVTLPTTGVELGDRIVVRGGSPVTATISISSTGVSDTIQNTDEQFSYTYLSTGIGPRWVKNLVDSHDAARVNSGTFNNARINFAAPAVIGSTTPNTGAFTSLSANNGTLTASAPVLNLSQTWNNAAVTFTGILATFTNTASNAASRLIDLRVGADSFFSVNRSGTITGVVASGGTLLTSSGSGAFDINASGGARIRFAPSGVGGRMLLWSGTGKYQFFPSAATANTSLGLFVSTEGTNNVMALENATNPQTFRIYNTYTDASNYERGFLRWTSNVLQIGTEKGGTGGSARALEFQTDGVTRMTIASSGGTINVGSGAQFGSNGIQVASTASLRFSGGAIGSSSDLWMLRSGSGIIRFATGSSTSTADFNRLQFGGTTSSFPALKRDTTTLQVKLADDSAFTAIQGKLTTETAYTAGAPTATGYLVLYDSNGTAYKVPAEAL